MMISKTIDIMSFIKRKRILVVRIIFLKTIELILSSYFKRVFREE